MEMGEMMEVVEVEGDQENGPVIFRSGKLQFETIKITSFHHKDFL